jgi:hypothetical protein
LAAIEGGVTVKYITISKLSPGIDNARKALEVYGKVGEIPGSESTWASADGKTFISIVEADSPDMTTAATYAPFFEEMTVLPVVPLDEAWMKAAQTALSNWA